MRITPDLIQITPYLPQTPRRLLDSPVSPSKAPLTPSGEPLPRPAANTCLYTALSYAENTRAHSLFEPIDTADLDYSSARVSLNFHPLHVVTWNEWRNVLYLLLRFVEMWDTREFFYTVEVLDGKEWYVVGRGGMVRF